MNFVAHSRGKAVSLQATLSASSMGTPGAPPVLPHHPITCDGNLRFEEDGRLACDHTAAPPDDHRTQQCIDHSVALLIIELSAAL